MTLQSTFIPPSTISKTPYAITGVRLSQQGVVWNMTRACTRLPSASVPSTRQVTALEPVTLTIRDPSKSPGEKLVEQGDDATTDISGEDAPIGRTTNALFGYGQL